MVEDLVLGPEPLAGVDVARALASVKAHVSVVLENGAVARGEHARVVGGRGELHIGIGHLTSQEEAALRLGEACKRALHLLVVVLALREIGLAKRNDRIAWVAILHNKVAGVARKRYILDVALGSGAKRDVFNRSVEMVCHRITA